MGTGKTQRDYISDDVIEYVFETIYIYGHKVTFLWLIFFLD